MDIESKAVSAAWLLVAVGCAEQALLEGVVAPPETVCPSGTNPCIGACVDPGRDPDNCGGCGRACLAGEVCALGTCAGACPQGLSACERGCVDLGLDRVNCGHCGVLCQEDQVCEAGACVCAPGTTPCGGYCVDLRTSSGNCGACGVACPEEKLCVGGACEGLK